MKTYTQVKMTKGDSFQVAWIPSPFAKRNKVIKIKSGGTWDDGWLVSDVYGTKAADLVEEQERDYVSVRAKIK